MGLTIAEKILLGHTDAKTIAPGQFIWAKVDLCLGNDITAPLAIDEFSRLNKEKVFDNTKIVLVPDHFAPAKDVRSASNCRKLAEFARRYRIRHFYEVGRMGIEHTLLPQRGLIGPGSLVVGADSHTCTYGALGAFACGVGSTDLAGVFATGRCWLRVPETIKFIYSGRLNHWVTGKDLILHTIGDIGVDGATYKVMEFTGEVIWNLPMGERFTMCNMAIEAGAKTGIIAPDEITLDYLRRVASNQKPVTRGKINWQNLKSDKDANYEKTYELDVSNLEPLVALPHLPSNVKPASKIKNVKIDQVVIGSCTNGRLSDLRIAAKILKNRRVHPNVRLIVIPATQKIYLEAIKEGLVEIFVRSQAVVSTPTCGPCIGGHAGVLAKGEVCLATTNRNFQGRMGHPESFVYLSNPAVCAASAIKGKICHPEDIGA
jgi:3-isopropylmalate/(R)-2-methylmalate dehydratase large subunit